MQPWELEIQGSFPNICTIFLTSSKLSPPVFSHLEVWTPGQNIIYQ